MDDCADMVITMCRTDTVTGRTTVIDPAFALVVGAEFPHGNRFASVARHSPSLPPHEWADARYYNRDIAEERKHVWPDESIPDDRGFRVGDAGRRTGFRTD